MRSRNWSPHGLSILEYALLQLLQRDDSHFSPTELAQSICTPRLSVPGAAGRELRSRSPRSSCRSAQGRREPWYPGLPREAVPIRFCLMVQERQYVRFPKSSQRLNPAPKSPATTLLQLFCTAKPFSLLLYWKQWDVHRKCYNHRTKVLQSHEMSVF